MDTPTLREPGLLVIDMDATLIEQEVIDVLGSMANVGDEMSAITQRAMRGELDFAQSLRTRVNLLQGLSYERVRGVSAQLHLTQGARELIDTLHAHRWNIGVVSGGFHEVLDEFLPQISVDRWSANHLQRVNGVLTGKITGSIMTPERKQLMLEQWQHELGIRHDQTVAVGDGANDRLMVQAAALGVAFCAQPVLQNYANICINQRDLRLVLNYFAK